MLLNVIMCNLKDGKHLINNRTQILNGDITTGNGVIHIVDKIIAADNATAKEANKADKLLGIV
jgi:uncharacterized surface protein with fasciclin (FAS1) repeats